MFLSEIIKKKNFPVTTNSSASNRPILVFLSCPLKSGNQQKPKKKLMAAGGLTKNFQRLASFYNI